MYFTHSVFCLRAKYITFFIGGLENTLVFLTLSGFLCIGALLEVELIRLKKEIAGPEELKNFYNMFNEEVRGLNVIILFSTNNSSLFHYIIPPFLPI